jgi:hypothetical protein
MAGFVGEVEGLSRRWEGLHMMKFPGYSEDVVIGIPRCLDPLLVRIYGTTRNDTVVEIKKPAAWAGF